MSDSLQARELQHARLPCPSPSPGTHSNTCSSSWWRHPTISFSVSPFSSCPQSSPASVFSSESAVCIRWPQYWSFSFSISTSNEYSGWFFFRIDWFDLLALQATLKSLLEASQESSTAPQLGDLLQKDLCQHTAPPRTVVISTPDPTASHDQPMSLPETPRRTQASLAQSPVGSLHLSPGSWCTHSFVCSLPGYVSPVLWKLYNQIPLTFKVRSPGDSQSHCQIPR